MRRREFLSLVGGAAVARPLAARAQQPKLPMIGFMSSRSAKDSAQLLQAFHRGLREAGYIEGQNVAMVLRLAEGQVERLPALAQDLVQRGVDIIVTIGGSNSTRAAVAATTAIPIVFIT